MNLHEFLNMSGYGAYVWSCYGLTALVLVGLSWSSRRALKTQTLVARRRLQASKESPKESPR
jgi:heme exporter protein D